MIDKLKQFLSMRPLRVWLGLILFGLANFALAAVPPLSVQGNRVLVGGQSVSLGGMSMFWGNNGWGGERFYTAGAVSYLKNDWKATVVRAAMGVEDGGGYFDDPNGMTNKVRTVVDAAIANDMYAIIDWHSHHAHEHDWSRAIGFFEQMARDYGHHNNVVYEIYNEPLQVSWSGAIKPYAEAVIRAIRAIDPDNLIIVGTPRWSQGVLEASRDPIRGFANIAYTLHFYAGTHHQWLRDEARQAMDNGIALYATEWGTVNANGDGGVNEGETHAWMNFLRDNGIHHANWSVNDKNEGASALNPGAGANGGWQEHNLTWSGRVVRDYLRDWPQIPGGVITTPTPTPTTTPTVPTPTPIPGEGFTVQAEDYSGSQGVQTESTSDAGGGSNVGWIDAGDWISFDNINIPAAGEYRISYRVASESGGGRLQFEGAGGSPVYGTMNIPSTGGWQNWQTISHDVTLPAGSGNFAIAALSGGWNINWFSITSLQTPTPTPTPVVTATPTPTPILTPTPTPDPVAVVVATVEAEDFIIMNGVQTESTSDTGGGQNVGWLDAGDWMSYADVNIPTSGEYIVEFRVASENGGGRLQFERAGGSPVYASVDIPSTGGWQNWTTVSETVTLAAGSQRFGIAIPSGGYNINWFRISTIVSPPTPTPTPVITPTPTPTSTPVVTPTPTPVVVTPTPTPVVVTPTPTPIVVTPTPTPIPGARSVSVTTSGLEQGSIRVSLNGSENMQLSSDGQFWFNDELNDGQSYSVTMDASGTTQSCYLAGANGTVSGADVDQVAVFCFGSAGGGAAGPVSFYGQLETSGNRINGSNTGQPAQVRGLSLFWSNTGWGQEKWWTAATVDRMVDEFKIELIRPAMGVEDGGGYIDDRAANVARVETIIEAAVANDIYVLIDWHSHHAEDNVGAAIEFFRDMAQRYGHLDNVIFEVYNEPLNTTSWDTVRNFSNQIVPVIREYSDNLIVVGSPWWSQRPDYAADSPVSGTNIAYTLHFYVGSHGNGVRNFAQTALDRGVPVFVSEYGVWDNGNSDGMSRQDWINFMDANDISSAYWAISDKNEPPSIFNLDGSLTEVGNWIKGSLETHAASAEWRGGSSNGPVDLPPQLMIDDVNDDDIMTFWGGEWSVYDDNPNDGASTITAAENLPVRGYINASYTLNKGGWEWDPFVGVSMSFNADATAQDLSGCEQIQYSYRGAAHDFRAEQENVVDFGYHFRSMPASSDWATAVVSWSSLNQPTWAASVSRDQSQIRAFSWQIAGADGSSGTLAIDNVSCLGATPPAGAQFPPLQF